MTVKELIDFLSKQNQNARVTLTKSVIRECVDDYEIGWVDSWEEDEVTDLEPCCLTVDVLGNGDVDIRYR